jgi:hypothetical protein
MSEKKFEIQIGSTADLRAAKEAQKALESAIQKTKEYGGESEVLEKKLQQVNKALESRQTKLVQIADLEKKAIQQIKAIGGETKTLEASLARTMSLMGSKSNPVEDAMAKFKNQMRGLNVGAATAIQERIMGAQSRGVSNIFGQAAKGVSEATKATAEITRGALSKINESVLDSAVRMREAYTSAGGGVKGLLSAIIGLSPKASLALAALTGGVLAAAKALKEFGQTEEVVRGLQQAMAQNGEYTDALNEKYQDLAASLQSATNIADEKWLKVLKELTQHGSLSNRIEKDVAAVKNLAGILDGDLESATLGISKALEGNFEMFSRWGLVVDEAATQAEKLDQLYKQLAEKGGGQLEASAGSLNGQFRGLKNSFNDLFESIGQRISDMGGLQVVFYGLGTTLEFVANKLGHVIPPLDALSRATKRQANAVIDAERYNRNYADSLKDMERFSNAASAALDNQRQKIRDVARMEQELADAQMQKKFAEIDALEKLGPGRGGISKEESIRRKSVVRNSTEDKKFKIGQNEKANEESLLEKDIQNKLSTIAEAAEEAKKAKAAILSEASFAAKRRKIERRGQQRVANIEYEYDTTIGAETGGYYVGPHKAEDMDIATKMNQRELESFDAKTDREVKGSKKRAADAEENAKRVAAEMAKEIAELQKEKDRIALERDHASNLQSIKNQTSFISDQSDLSQAQRDRLEELNKKAESGPITPAESKEKIGLQKRIRQTRPYTDDRRRREELLKKPRLSPDEREELSGITKRLRRDNPTSDYEIEANARGRVEDPFLGPPVPPPRRAAPEPPFYGPPESPDALMHRRATENMRINPLPQQRIDQEKSLRRSISENSGLNEKALDEILQGYSRQNAVLVKVLRQLSNLSMRLDHLDV